MNKESLYSIIDINDYEKVKNFPYTWHSFYARKTKTYYCVATEYFKDENGVTQHKPLYLEAFLENPNKYSDVYIDHENHDTLDNRRCNLRASTNSDNSKHRSHRNSNNKSGYRNVAYVKRSKHPYWVQIVVNGKNTNMGRFDDVHKAAEVAEAMRNKYYGNYAGNS